MARYDVTAPAAGYNGEVAGVRFYQGKAVVDEKENPAAVAYMRRRGYTLTEVREEQPEETSENAAPDKPKAADSKAAWVAYIAATTDLTDAEAEDLTKAELMELAENGEQS